MKRRDFLTQSAAMVCAMFPGLSLAKPCPPILRDAQGPTTCGQGGDAEADWQARISGPGVVWYHNFDSDDEVNNFRWNGGIGNDPEDKSDPGRCIRNTELGFNGGGCLQLIHPVGTGDAPSWWRPFGALAGGTTTGNGRGEDDPAAKGTLRLNAWNPRNAGENESYFASYYAHKDYVGANGFSANDFDGNEFWLQYRFRYTASRRDPGTPNAGKLAFIATTQQTPNQELVIQNERDGVWKWYTNFGSDGSLGAGNKPQPGGEYASCDLNSEPAGCWGYPTDELGDLPYTRCAWAPKHARHVVAGVCRKCRRDTVPDIV